MRNAFSRQRTFFWFIVAVMCFCMRSDSIGGVSSFIRSSNLVPSCYQRLLHFFHSQAIDLGTLTHLWVGIVFQIFQGFLVTLNGHPILVLDGLNIAKGNWPGGVILKGRTQIVTAHPLLHNLFDYLA